MALFSEQAKAHTLVDERRTACRGTNRPFPGRYRWDPPVSDLPFTLAIENVQTARLLAERFAEDEERPPWTEPRAGSLQVFVDDETSNIDVVYDANFQADDLVIAVMMVARFAVSVNGNPVSDLTKMLSKLDADQAATVASEGMTVLAPYVREVVHTTSMRLNPESPFVLPPFPGPSTLRPAESPATD